MMDADGTRGDLPRKYRHGQSPLKKYKDKMVVDCTVLVEYLVRIVWMLRAKRGFVLCGRELSSAQATAHFGYLHPKVVTYER